MTHRRWALGLTIAIPTLAACAYYNGLYNANQLANKARTAESQGRRGEARSLWVRAAVKAESVATRYPDSKYRDDALLLQGLALSRSGECREAVTPLSEAVATSSDGPLRAAARVLLGGCFLQTGDARSADEAVAPLTDHPDTATASRANWIRGQAALVRHAPEEALRHLDRTSVPEALFDRALARLAAGRLGEAAATLDTARWLAYDEPRWEEALARVGRVEPRVASALVDRLLDDQHLTAGQRGRLLVADGLRWRRADPSRAAARLGLAVEEAGDSVEASLARAHITVSEVRRTARLDTLPVLLGELDAVMADGALVVDLASRFSKVLEAIVEAVGPGPASDLIVFRRAEEARDVMAAPLLATRLFRLVWERYPESVIAPKAMLAAASLAPAARDSLWRELARRYPDSPYTLAARGLPAPGFAVLEDSIRVLLQAQAISLDTGLEERLVPWPRGVLPDTGAVRQLDGVLRPER